MGAADVSGDLEKILPTVEQIDARLAQLAVQIDEEYRGRDSLLIGVLCGAVTAMAGLPRKIHILLEMDWMAVPSYGSGTKSSGVARIPEDLDTDIQGRSVLIVEDVIDLGPILSWLRSNLLSRGPESARIATTLRKLEAAKVAIDVDYVGSDIPSEFVVGYGLDYAERYRHLPFMGALTSYIYGG